MTFSTSLDNLEPETKIYVIKDQFLGCAHPPCSGCRGGYRAPRLIPAPGEKSLWLLICRHSPFPALRLPVTSSLGPQSPQLQSELSV